MLGTMLGIGSLLGGLFGGRSNKKAAKRAAREQARLMRLQQELLRMQMPLVQGRTNALMDILFSDPYAPRPVLPSAGGGVTPAALSTPRTVSGIFGTMPLNPAQSTKMGRVYRNLLSDIAPQAPAVGGTSPVSKLIGDYLYNRSKPDIDLTGYPELKESILAERDEAAKRVAMDLAARGGIRSGAYPKRLQTLERGVADNLADLLWQARNQAYLERRNQISKAIGLLTGQGSPTVASNMASSLASGYGNIASREAAAGRVAQKDLNKTLQDLVKVLTT